MPKLPKRIRFTNKKGETITFKKRKVQEGRPNKRRLATAREKFINSLKKS